MFNYGRDAVGDARFESIFRHRVFVMRVEVMFQEELKCTIGPKSGTSKHNWNLVAYSVCNSCLDESHNTLSRILTLGPKVAGQSVLYCELFGGSFVSE